MTQLYNPVLLNGPKNWNELPVEDSEHEEVCEEEPVATGQGSLPPVTGTGVISVPDRFGPLSKRRMGRRAGVVVSVLFMGRLTLSELY